MGLTYATLCRCCHRWGLHYNAAITGCSKCACSSFAEPAPPKREHCFTIPRGELRFCEVCGDPEDDSRLECAPNPLRVPEFIEEHIRCRMVARNIDWGTDADLRAYVARHDLDLYDHQAPHQNVSAAINTIVGGWNRRVP